jgi:hypothetical protein
MIANRLPRQACAAVMDGAQIALLARNARAARPGPLPSPSKGPLMKTPLAALFFAVAASAATAQLSSPISPGAAPTVKADPGNTAVERAPLRIDREKVRADEDRLRSAREAHDEAAARAAQAALKTDLETLRSDRGRLADANSGESLKR